MKISVVLPTYHRPELLREQLEALARQAETPSEVLVVDNGPTEAAAAVVEAFLERFPALRYVVAAERHGAGYAANAGARAATGDALAFLNDDDVVAPGWLEAVQAALARHDAVAARIDWDTLNPAWAVGARGRHQERGLSHWWRPGAPSFAAAATLAVRRAVHETLGGFDESIHGTEDVDYCWRLRDHGYELAFVPDAVVRMRVRTTLGAIFRQALEWGENDVALYRKHRHRFAPRPRPLRAALKGWAGTALLLLRARRRADLATVARHAGWRLGLLRGSLRHRVLLLSD